MGCHEADLSMLGNTLVSAFKAKIGLKCKIVLAPNNFMEIKKLR